MVTQGKPITHNQTLATNHAAIETMVEQVLSKDHAMVRLKEFSSKIVKLL
jgi:hypothetical protein